ncbi:MAG: hypothetical protein UV28_C0008G0011 [Candidatus Collierbacteria bacterium GW2011_GWE2_42_48]|nr:MAG: hypothetical protein UV28_C0008G0011 [Candidatus Collierbacteria bacterium GW2011_GWE2_42_48]
MEEDKKESTLKKIGEFILGAVVVYILINLFGWLLYKLLALFL